VPPKTRSGLSRSEQKRHHPTPRGEAVAVAVAAAVVVAAPASSVTPVVVAPSRCQSRRSRQVTGVISLARSWQAAEAREGAVREVAAAVGPALTRISRVREAAVVAVDVGGAVRVVTAVVVAVVRSALLLPSRQALRLSHDRPRLLLQPRPKRRSLCLLPLLRQNLWRTRTSLLCLGMRKIKQFARWLERSLYCQRFKAPVTSEQSKVLTSSVTLLAC